jgi:hypothetical protein
MKQNLSVDVISDLNLREEDSFDWTDKPTSLFCVIAGGISNNLDKVQSVLEHLSKLYRGVFYIDGSTEHTLLEEYAQNVDTIKNVCDTFTNVVYLHNHVVVLNGVAFVACNGWFKNNPNIENIDDISSLKKLLTTDIAYLSGTIKNLQEHRETKRIVVITSSIPCEELAYRGVTSEEDKLDPAFALISDANSKVKNWVFGGSDLLVDTVINGRRYLNNPYIDGQPYWPKKIEV